MMTRNQIDRTLREKCRAKGIPFVGCLMSAYAIRFDVDLGDSDSDERFEAKAKILEDEALFNSLAVEAKVQYENVTQEDTPLMPRTLVDVLDDIRWELEKIEHAISCI